MAEWASAIASIVGVSAAVFLSLQANRIAREVKEAEKERGDDFKKNEQERQQAEKERERRAKTLFERRYAGALLAWWTKWDESWGVLVHNDSGLIYHKVSISTVSNGYHNTLQAKVLPPGLYFVSSTNDGQEWRVAVDPSHFKPILNSSKHEVESIKYTDVLGMTWIWEPDKGVSQVDN